jgi:hypothetical protein
MEMMLSILFRLNLSNTHYRRPVWDVDLVQVDLDLVAADRALHPVRSALLSVEP